MFDKYDGLSNLWNGHHVKYRNNNESSQTVIHQEDSKARFSLFYDRFKWMSIWMRSLWKAIQFTMQTIRTLKRLAARLFEESDDEQCGRAKAALSAATEQVGIITTFSVVKDAKEKFRLKNSMQRYETMSNRETAHRAGFFTRHIFFCGNFRGTQPDSLTDICANGEENIVTWR